MLIHRNERTVNEARKDLEHMLEQHEIFGISGNFARVIPSTSLMKINGGKKPRIKAATVDVKLWAIGHDNLKVKHVENTPARQGKEESPEEKLAAFICKLAERNKNAHPNVHHEVVDWKEGSELKGFRVILSHKDG